MQRASTDKLVEDLKVVVQDADALLRATADHSGEKAADARRRIQASLDSARARLHSVQQSAVELGEDALHDTENYVRQNPWQAVGIAAGVGLILGVLISRR
jgi:ElaB/YqjD/DUF883 family membrane-anchored ribosome-binding protein